MGQKASDHTCIPLCARHHRTGPLAYHHLGEKEFRRVHKLDVRELAQRLSEKPRLVIEGVWFVTNIGINPEGLVIWNPVRFHIELGPQYALEQLKALRTEMFCIEFRQRRRAA